MLKPLPEDRIEARSQGSYSAAGATVAGELSAVSPIAVPSVKLIGVAKLFSRAKLPVTLSVGELLTVDNGVFSQTVPILPKFEPAYVASVEVDVGEMRRELRDLGPSVATAMTTPIFVGMRLRTVRGWLGIETNNGYSLAVQSAIEAAGEAEIDVVVNVSDLKKALTIIAGTWVGVGRHGDRLLLLNDVSWASIPLMADGSVWPRIPFPAIADLGQSVEIPTRVLADLVRASAIYPGGRIIFRPEWGEVIVETEDMGSGQYQQKLTGRMVSPVYMGAVEVAIMAKASQRTTVTLNLDGQTGMASLGDHRRALLTLRFMH
jgi:hypothetical protein